MKRIVISVVAVLVLGSVLADQYYNGYQTKDVYGNFQKSNDSYQTTDAYGNY